MKHLSIREQQQLICHEKISFLKKIYWKIHLFFCRRCRLELSSNHANIKMIRHLHEHYLAHLNNNCSNVEK